MQPPRESLTRRLAEAGIKSGRENVLWLDDAVGALLRKLEACGLDGNTIIFYFNDNGMNAKGHLYEGGTRSVSFVWRKNGFPCGKTVDALVSNIDFAPTILDLAGVPPPPDTFDGTSLRPLLEAKTVKLHDSLYFEMGYSRAVLKGNWKYLALRYPGDAANMSLEARQRALDAANDRLARANMKPHNTDPSAPLSHLTLIPGGGSAEHSVIKKYPAYTDPDQLYDLDKDPNERRNLARDPQYAGTLEGMKRELKKYLDMLPGAFPELKAAAGPER